jgi:hypothetical protein
MNFLRGMIDAPKILVVPNWGNIIDLNHNPNDPGEHAYTAIIKFDIGNIIPLLLSDSGITHGSLMIRYDYHKIVGRFSMIYKNNGFSALYAGSWFNIEENIARISQKRFTTALNKIVHDLNTKSNPEYQRMMREVTFRALGKNVCNKCQHEFLRENGRLICGCN